MQTVQCGPLHHLPAVQQTRDILNFQSTYCFIHLATNHLRENFFYATTLSHYSIFICHDLSSQLSTLPHTLKMTSRCLLEGSRMKPGKYDFQLLKQNHLKNTAESGREGNFLKVYWATVSVSYLKKNPVLLNLLSSMVSLFLKCYTS